jgi:PAS domain S-box-containing protein
MVEKAFSARAYSQRYGILDFCPAGMCLINKEFSVIYWNRQIENWTGISKESIVGHDIRDFFPKFKETYYTVRINSVFSDGPPVVFSSQLHRHLFPSTNNDHKKRSYHITISSVPVNLLNPHALFAIEDVTELYSKIHDYKEEIIRRKQIESELKENIETKELLVREVHHRVKNNLAMIASMINLQSSYTGKDQTHDIYSDLQSRIQAIGLVHEKLYQNQKITAIDSNIYIKDLSENIMQSFTGTSDDINILYDLEEIELSIDVLIPLGLILTEIITNAIKYAFPERKNNSISISLKKDQCAAQLFISDNGIGLPKDICPENSATLGLILIDTLVSQLEGEMRIFRERGTTFLISFPLT